MVHMIPLSRIRPSDRNVRKTKNGQTLEQLADNIFAYDILQNIVVEPVKKPRGHFAVVAGDRRYAAAHILVGRGDWQADRDIPALVVNGTGQHLSAISLAENFQREAMSAADECLGFQTIIVDEGGDAATIAKRFGIKKRFVDGRLRLASLAAPIFAALAEGNPGLALDYALFAMADKSVGYRQYGTTIEAKGPQDPNVGELPVSRAREVIAQAKDELEAGWTGHKTDVERFQAFRALDDDAKAAWLAFVVAMSLEAKPTYDARQNPLQNRVAQILDIDVASWWRPTAINYFLGVNKAALLTVLTEIGGATLSSRYAASKKAEIAENCEKLFSGNAIVESDVRARALAWVPNTMLFLEAAAAAPLEGGGDDLDDEDAASEDADETGDAPFEDADDDTTDPVDEEATIAA